MHLKNLDALAPRESPDFALRLGAYEIGVEVTEAIEEHEARGYGSNDEATSQRHSRVHDVRARLHAIVDAKEKKLELYREAGFSSYWLLVVTSHAHASGLQDSDIRGRTIESSFDAVGVYCRPSVEEAAWALWLKAPDSPRS